MPHATRKPLTGLKVLDLSTLLPGPYASMLLADMGAEVLRVEGADREDMLDSMPPLVMGQSAIRRYLHRGKKSLALNLKNAEAIAIIEKLISQYDVLIEQFRPGVMNRLGLGYDRLKQLNPRLIYCSITGYGQSGPWAERAGHDLNYMAVSGLADATSVQGRPQALGFQAADIAGGSHHAVMGILAAVIHRYETGLGQQVDVSMTDAAFALHGLSSPGELADSDDNPVRYLLNGSSFYDYYQTADQRYLAVAALESKFSQRLAELLETPELHQLIQGTVKDQDKAKTLLTDLIKMQPLNHWQKLFEHEDVCVEPVLSIQEAADHPQLQHRGMVLKNSSGLTQVACPIRFSRAGLPGQTIMSSPLPGQDTRELLLNIGLSPLRIGQLVSQGAIKMSEAENPAETV